MTQRIVPLILLLALTNLACELTEPDPLQIEGQTQPEFLPIVLGNLTPGEVLTGSVSIVLPDSLFNPGVRRVVFFIDSLVYRYYDSRPTGPIQLDLSTLSNGGHTLMFVAYDTKGFPGLLNLIGMPNRIYTATILVDNSPPTPVQNLTVQWNDFVTLTWQQSPDQNFHAYFVRKHLTDGTGRTVVLDTIFDRGTTQYIDQSESRVFGATASYSVGTWNSVVANYTSPVSMTLEPQVLPVNDVVYALASPVADEEYIVTPENRLVALSTQTNAVLRQTSLSVPGMLSVGPVVMNPEGTRLYHLLQGMDSSQSVAAYDAASFAFQKQIPVPFRVLFAPAIAAGPGNTLFVVDTSRTTRILDFQAGTVTDSLPPFSKQVVQLSITPDGHSLLPWTYEYFGVISSALYRYDLTSGRPVLTAQKALGTLVEQLQFTPLGDKLILVHRDPGAWYVDLLDVATLTQIRSFPAPADLPAGAAAGWVDLSDQFLYITYAYPSYTTLFEVDLASGVAARSWKFKYYVGQIHRTRNGKYLYVFGTSPTGTPRGYVIPL